VVLHSTTEFEVKGSNTASNRSIREENETKIIFSFFNLNLFCNGNKYHLHGVKTLQLGATIFLRFDKPGYRPQSAIKLHM
jgi:hypothetical protein